MRPIIWSFLLLLLVASCSKEDDAAAQQLETDIALIDAWLADQGLVAESTSSGLRYIIEDPGNGTSFPTSSSFVTVAYVGKLLDGTIFEASPGGNPPSFSLSGTIKGWREGIPKFRKGGKGKLLIPSGLAYGAYSPSSKVPANAVLIFDIQLIDFQ
ncbi:MAG: FKBP-type peptidyl-prolyl cis-trans isomerase [Saprospiraceae bacterium]|nr:FKBP-type peptidyl-prolyl cis-trans isomerase [Saprospiraceae bacterium]MCB9311947.1 FKBP-type peptidyl-prolyl cis-trans isomerase [Lewinellaceae bacterium]HRW76703.1 FKBP-type peptidyl-prolyl cis-trans isomerase [Saprospiraceae bacterium]